MPKVLLVDPEPDSRGAFERALRGAGYEVSVAASGSFALTQLEWDRPHVIVTQARVDDMDGCELFGIVRSDPKTGDIPFLLLAGLERHIAGQAAEAGVDRLCTGHVSVVGFLEGVRGLLAGEPAPGVRDSGAGADRAGGACAADDARLAGRDGSARAGPGHRHGGQDGPAGSRARGGTRHAGVRGRTARPR